MSNTYELVKNASVQVIKKYGTKHQPIAEIVVDDKYSHEFPTSSRVSKHLSLIEPKQLEQRLSGGTFMFVNDELVDFRDGAYKGFVHDDDTIKAFFDVLGVHRRSEHKFKHSRKRDEEDMSKDPYVLRKVWDKTEISVPGYNQGGDFYTQLSYTWNPFVKTVNSSFDLVRLICENGAIGLTSFLNTRVPIMNKWEEHLDIATRQIQNKVSSIVVERFQSMPSERVSVADLMLLENHARERWNGTTDTAERAQLSNIVSIVSPRDNLGQVYRDGVFDNKSLSAQVPGHLSAFDAYNIATEMRTHTMSSSKSSDHALDRFANVLLFDRMNHRFKGVGASSVRQSAFSDPTRAFFGEVA